MSLTTYHNVPVPSFMYGTAWKKEATTELVQLAVVAGFTVQRVFRGFPEWLLRFNVGGWEGRTEIWSIYRVGGPG